MKKATSIALFALALLSACGTIEGFGEDISAAARAVDRRF